MSATGGLKRVKPPSPISLLPMASGSEIGQNTWLRELPKALTTTLFWKQKRGTRLIVVHNGKKVRDTWGIRRRESKVVMIDYDSVSTTAWVLV